MEIEVHRWRSSSFGVVTPSFQNTARSNKPFLVDILFEHILSHLIFAEFDDATATLTSEMPTESGV